MKIKFSVSVISFLFAVTIILFSAFFYYPKWEQEKTEATLSWDVSGYYLYLPAIFIYNDVKECKFLDDVIKKYQPTPNPMQGYRHSSGGFVIKYSAGQAIQYLPWFLVANALAEPFGYPADGFSKPYQVGISWGSLIIAILGLWITRKNLLNFFSEKATAFALLAITLGSNYLNYTSFDGAMTHNWLFTAYSLLILFTIKYYQKPIKKWAILIGVLVGWMTITRPTEIISAIIPMFWGVRSLASFKERIRYFIDNYVNFLFAVLFLFVMLFIQVAYWRYVSGQWIVYSYEEQGFSWLHPHTVEVLFSYRVGWLVYSPVMAMAIIGLFNLFQKHKDIFFAIVLHCFLFLYVTSAWDIWWYGGSLGMRAMVQSYAIWAFPLTALFDQLYSKRFAIVLIALVTIISSWINLWWTYQAHKPNGLFITEQMNKSLYWKGLLSFGKKQDVDRMRDNSDVYPYEKRKDIHLVYQNDFERDSTGVTSEQPLNGKKSLLLNKEKQFSPEINLPKDLVKDQKWIRISLNFKCEPKEWEEWKMTQLIVRFSQNGDKIKDNMMRLQRYCKGEEQAQTYLDTEVPSKHWDKVVIFFWNGESQKTVKIDDLNIETFN